MKVCFVRWQKIELKNLCVGKKKEIKNEALAWLFKVVSSSCSVFKIMSIQSDTVSGLQALNTVAGNEEGINEVKKRRD